ncbi:hypothetical protein SAY87_026074 [Trapa incisa]|uniref:FAD-binding PCMH-type domain-containing protein n=1 Tax=Trapa incisa TaxID=236973 RepID=A0AAN7JJY0_9MYRT|nr:hypothetical protein SAY87_026074 [Trapa incisa]
MPLPQLLFSLWTIHLISVVPLGLLVLAMPPQSPVRCGQAGCKLSNSYGKWGDRKDCVASKVAYPTTEEGLRSAVAEAIRSGLKVKVVSKFSHTIPKLACPGANTSILISTEKYDSVIDIDVPNMSVTVDSGVSLRNLIDKVEEKGLSLVAAPYWEGVSVGGIISTGAHGSSWWGRGGSVHDHVVSLSLVVPASESDGYAKIISLEGQGMRPGSPLDCSVKLSLEKAFKRSITYNFTRDEGLEDTFMDHANKYEFADITWYPSKWTAVYRYDSRVPLDTPGDGLFDFLGFRSNSVFVSTSVRAAVSASVHSHRLQEADRQRVEERPNLYGLSGDRPPGEDADLRVVPVHAALEARPDLRVGSTHDGLSFYETTAIFPARHFGAFIRDVKRLRDLNPESLCGLDVYNGLLIRFVKGSRAVLGQGEDSVVADFNYYRAGEATNPRLNQDIFEEVEQMAFFRHGARPHWAKIRKVAFIGAAGKYPGMTAFLKARKWLDPKGVFSSEWSDEILFGKEGEKADGCALEGLCICSEDRHCSPSKWYFCRQGLVYKDAWVCTFERSSMS